MDETTRRWIESPRAYNARTTLRLGPGETGAKYLLLHSGDETKTGRLLKIAEEGPRVLSKRELMAQLYPTTPSKDYYLVYTVSELTGEEFSDLKWDVTKLAGYPAGRKSVFSVTLAELMQAGEE